MICSGKPVPGTEEGTGFILWLFILRANDSLYNKYWESSAELEGMEHEERCHLFILEATGPDPGPFIWSSTQLGPKNRQLMEKKP